MPSRIPKRVYHVDTERNGNENESLLENEAEMVEVESRLPYVVINGTSGAHVPCSKAVQWSSTHSTSLLPASLLNSTASTVTRSADEHYRDRIESCGCSKDLPTRRITRHQL
jgi:hypothetical protein